MNKHYTIYLKNKHFDIPFCFKSIGESSIAETLFGRKEYVVQSDVSESTLKSFLDFWVEKKEQDVNNDNYYEYCLLSQEFQIKFIDDFLKSKEDTFDEYEKNLIKLKDDSLNDKFLIEQVVSRKLDIYLNKYPKELMSLPIQQLYRLFNNSECKIYNQKQAYQLIISKYQETNNRDIFILLPFLDGNRLNKDILNECFQKKEERNNFLPKFDFSSIEDKLKEKDVKISEHESRLQIQSETIHKLLTLFLDDQYIVNYSHFYLPINKDWTKVNINEFTFSDDVNKYALKCSSTWKSSDDYAITKLLNGKKESEGGGVWATNYCNTAYIEIDFIENPVCINLISFTSRNTYHTEAPSNFDILGRNGNDDFVLLKSFTDLSWKPNEKKVLKFVNWKCFNSYRLNFNSCALRDNNGSCYGFAEFNVGRIEL